MSNAFWLQTGMVIFYKSGYFTQAIFVVKYSQHQSCSWWYAPRQQLNKGNRRAFRLDCYK